MISSKMRLERILPVCCFFLFGIAAADEFSTGLGGHIKGRVVGDAFPNDSLFRVPAGSDSIDFESDLRANFVASKGQWSFAADYQLIAVHGDSIEWTRSLDSMFAPFNDRLANDDRRLFDLTHVIRDDSKTAILHRLDRLSVSFTSDKAVARFGRQALSWGNGLFYSPMDLVNPFDPAAIDTEFKAGDDMLYLQYLRDNGDDVQGAVVFRRDPLTGDLESGQATISVKYHGFAGDSEFDVLVAESYGDAVLGLGGIKSIGGAIWRADLVLSDTDAGLTTQLVTNLNYSWTWGGKNVNGAVEYYFNGFGESGDYAPANLAANPELIQRITRRELFALGRHYLAGSLLIELSPLWTVTPTVLTNLGDPSALLQLVTQYSLSDNMTFLGSINLPLGRNGTEFGGIDTGLADTYLSTDASLFAQVAWYF